MEAALKAAHEEAHIAAEQQQAAIAARCNFTLFKMVYRRLSSDTDFKQTASQTLSFLMRPHCPLVLEERACPYRQPLIIAGKQSKHASATWRQS